MGTELRFFLSGALRPLLPIWRGSCCSGSSSSGRLDEWWARAEPEVSSTLPEDGPDGSSSAGNVNGDGPPGPYASVKSLSSRSVRPKLNLGGRKFASSSIGMGLVSMPDISSAYAVWTYKSLGG